MPEQLPTDRDHASGDAAHEAFTRFVGPLLAEDGALVFDLVSDG